MRLTGFYDNKLAYTYEDPDHWSRFTNTLELSLDGRNGPLLAQGEDHLLAQSSR